MTISSRRRIRRGDRAERVCCLFLPVLYPLETLPVLAFVHLCELGSFAFFGTPIGASVFGGHMSLDGIQLLAAREKL